MPGGVVVLLLASLALPLMLLVCRWVVDSVVAVTDIRSVMPDCVIGSRIAGICGAGVVGLTVDGVVIAIVVTL